MPRLESLSQEQKDYFESGVRALVSSMNLSKAWMLHFEHPEIGMRVVLGLREHGRTGQCRGIAVSRGRRCRLDAVHGSPYCACHQSLKGTDDETKEDCDVLEQQDVLDYGWDDSGVAHNTAEMVRANKPIHALRTWRKLWEE